MAWFTLDGKAGMVISSLAVQDLSSNPSQTAHYPQKETTEGSILPEPWNHLSRFSAGLKDCLTYSIVRVTRIHVVMSLSSQRIAPFSPGDSVTPPEDVSSTSNMSAKKEHSTAEG